MRTLVKRGRGRALILVSISLAGIVSGGCASWKPVVAQRDQLCRDWKEITRSKDDRLSKGTAEQIAGNNVSRSAWGCNA